MKTEKNKTYNINLTVFVFLLLITNQFVLADLITNESSNIQKPNSNNLKTNHLIGHVENKHEAAHGNKDFSKFNENHIDMHHEITKLSKKGSPNEINKLKGNMFPNIFNNPPDVFISCKNQCSFQGFCLEGLCFCKPGYMGDDCSLTLDSTTNKTIMMNTTCLNNCNENGKCSVNGRCICDKGFSGFDCSIGSNNIYL